MKVGILEVGDGEYLVVSVKWEDLQGTDRYMAHIPGENRVYQTAIETNRYRYYDLDEAKAFAKELHRRLNPSLVLELGDEI